MGLRERIERIEKANGPSAYNLRLAVAALQAGEEIPHGVSPAEAELARECVRAIEGINAQIGVDPDLREPSTRDLKGRQIA